MLIVFQTSPFDSLFHPTPVSYLLGFELQVEVIISFMYFFFHSNKKNPIKNVVLYNFITSVIPKQIFKPNQDFVFNFINLSLYSVYF